MSLWAGNDPDVDEALIGSDVERLADNGDADLLVVNAARVSHGKRKTVVDDADRKLIRYLAEHKHDSPFRHPQLTLRIECSEVVARQLYKHQVGSAMNFRDTPWNEISGRYVEYDAGVYMPLVYRGKPESNVKQGSGRPIWEQDKAWRTYYEAVQMSQEAYQSLLAIGVCKEQARMVLPMATKTQFIVTGSLSYWIHLVRLRTDSHAQKECRDVANRIDGILKQWAPESYSALMLERIP